MTRSKPEPERLTRGDEEFLAQVRSTYRAHPAYAPALPESRRGRSGPLLLVAAAVVAVAGGTAVLTQLTATDPGGTNPASEDTSSGVPASGAEAPTEVPQRLLVPGIAAQWPTQSVADCSAYSPRGDREVVYVDHFTEDCIGMVPPAATVIFSSTTADQLGGVSWEEGSRPWGTVAGHAVLRKVSGAELMISSRMIQGVWVDSPREYAVFVGSDVLPALDSLVPPERPRKTGGESEPTRER